MKDRVIVVGAGIGGLATALRLQAQGLDVTIVEAQAYTGGKMRTVDVSGQKLDAGPTVLTMRWVFEELFEAIGEDLNATIPMSPLTVLARHGWDGSDQRLDLYADHNATVEAIGGFAGSAAARRYQAFCAESRRFYQTLEGPFLKGGKPTIASVTREVGLSRLPDLLALKPMSTLWKALGKHFKDPRLRQLFGRYATYSGSSPFQSPATLMLIAHVEREGVWQVDGGMAALALSLTKLFEAKGGKLLTSAPVDRITVELGRATGIVLAGGAELKADAVVFNGDANALATGLLGDGVSHASPGTAPQRRSLSALAWQMVAETEGFPLSRHTVFFGPDYEREFNDLGAGRLPSNPTVYVCAQDRGDEGTAPGPERLHLHVNAPATGDHAPPSDEELHRCEQETFQLMARCGLSVTCLDQAQTVRTGPQDFEKLFPATGGALYGPSTHGWKASFDRANPRTKLPGLYLAGGSVHPGAGVPMAALSGRLAAQMLMEDRASTRR